ncbi:histidine phosphotransferase family protein [Paracoccus sp. (in: a-proteobacteria)]|uniref:histidine phosphotransferase family protein n=1 Tax=Paracoccus sp. TaxID=267 RepID=UPI00289ED64B|nr:histidine phosphotransferase family protein [Paracoccus sp. (in: a-proteobacteria)]
MIARSVREQSDAELPERLAALVGSRLCHDLISPLGAIGNGVELLQLSGEFPGIQRSSEVQLISDSVSSARDRITLFRMAFGHTVADQRISCNELGTHLKSFDRNGRLRIRFEATGDMPRTEGRMILLALMCFETAMPWGGRVLICRGPTGWRLLAEAARVKVDDALWAWLSDTGEDEGKQRPELTASEVHFGLLGLFARQSIRPIQWEIDDNGGEISF